MMGVTTTQDVLWLAAFILELILCVLAFRRRWHKRLSFFSAYLVVLTFEEPFYFFLYRIVGFTSKTALYSYWVGQAVLLSGEGLSIAELVWTASRSYPGFRTVTKWVLTITAVLLLGRAGIVSVVSHSRLPQFILTLETNLEIAAAVVLVLLLALANVYEVYLPISEKLIAAGFVTYSAIQVVNNAISIHWLRSYFYAWNVIRVASFHVALIVWLIAFLLPFANAELTRQWIPRTHGIS
jgi:hypothetical protein